MRILPAALALILVVSGAVIVYATAARNRFPVTGQREHDAGIVRFDGSQTIVEHAFTLTNCLGKSMLPVQVTKAYSGVDADFDLSEWKPGEQRSIVVRMTLHDFGKVTGCATIMCSNAPPIPVVLSATGWSNRAALQVGEGDTRLSVDGTGEFSVRYFTFETQAAPPDPELTVDHECDVRFLGWTKEMDAQPEQGIPARYRGEIKLQAAPQTDRVRIRVSIGEAAAGQRFFR